MLVFNTFMLVDELLKYREFDRLTHPAPRIPFHHDHSMDEIIEWIKIHGISSADPLKLSIFQNTALLTNGNHRIAAAFVLEMKTVPVEITFYDTLQELEDTFYPHTIQRFKSVEI